jgi:hypothetical protein
MEDDINGSIGTIGTKKSMEPKSLGANKYNQSSQDVHAGSDKGLTI